LSKHNRGNRGNRGKQGKVDGHKAKILSPAGEAVQEAKAKSQEATEQEAKAQTKAGLTLTTDIDSGQVTATDKQGQQVLTTADKAKVKAVKVAQAKATEARRMALEAQREAKEALSELTVNGSGLVKTMVTELEAKIKEAEATVTDIDACMDILKTKRAAALVPLDELLTEYKGLTGLDKASKSKAKGGKAKANNGNGNGRFTSTVKLQGDRVKVLVTHTESKSLFESELYPKNGTVKKDDWLSLRHRFIAHFEAADTKNKVDRAMAAADYNLILRAYLSNLKGKVEAVKAIV